MAAGADDRRTVYIDDDTWGDLAIAAGVRSKAEKRTVSVAEIVRRGVIRELSVCDGAPELYEEPRRSGQGQPA